MSLCVCFSFADFRNVCLKFPKWVAGTPKGHNKWKFYICACVCAKNCTNFSF